MEQRRVLRSAFQVGGFTMMSRLLGLVRDTLTAAFFGTSAAMSDFVVAFRLPNAFRALFGEGALASAFIPVFMETRSKEGDEAAWGMARRVITLTSLVLLALVLTGMGACTVLLHTAWGAKAAGVLRLARIMLPYMMFICLTALAQGILNSFKRFALPAFTPCLLNLTWIAFVIFVCPRLGPDLDRAIYGVAWGVFAAGVVQWAAQVPALRHTGYRAGWAWDPRDARVRRFLSLMGPTALGQSVNQINMLINGVMARWATDWAPSALFYAERMIYLPQGLIATAFSTVLLPLFSSHAAEGDHGRMRSSIQDSLRVMLFVMIPASAGLFALSEPIIRLVFGWGRFDETSVQHTALVLRCYAPGLLIFGLAKVFVPAFYAQGDTRTPFRSGLTSVGLNFSLNIASSFLLAADWKAASLACAAVLSETVNAAQLGFRLHRVIGSPGWGLIARSAGRSLLCAVAMALVAAAGHAVLSKMALAWTPDSRWASAAALAAVLPAAAVLYFALARLLRAPEVHETAGALLRRREQRSAPPPHA